MKRVWQNTNGIPQGSLLMDFIAEIVLKFADAEFTKRLSLSEIKYYKVIRYRDDYRIFVRNPNTGEIIMKALGETLSELGMSLHSNKTKKSESIVSDSIKADKLYNLNLSKNRIFDKDDFRDELIKIYLLGREYPNSGSILKRLAYLSEGLKKLKDIPNYIEVISIVINIGCENPRSFSDCMLSNL